MLPFAIMMMLGLMFAFGGMDFLTGSGGGGDTDADETGGDTDSDTGGDTGDETDSVVDGLSVAQFDAASGRYSVAPSDDFRRHTDIDPDDWENLPQSVLIVGDDGEEHTLPLDAFDPVENPDGTLRDDEFVHEMQDGTAIELLCYPDYAYVDGDPDGELILDESEVGMRVTWIGTEGDDTLATSLFLLDDDGLIVDASTHAYTDGVYTRTDGEGGNDTLVFAKPQGLHQGSYAMAVG